MKNKILIKYLRIALGCVFVFSAVVKLFPVESFEFIIVTQVLSNWNIVPYLSRIIIGFELFLGVALLTELKPTRLFILLTILLLIAFCFQLIYSLVQFPSSKNCGCFGEVLPMSPLSALIKNIILILISLPVYYHYNKVSAKNFRIPALFISLIYIAVFLLFPVHNYDETIFSKSTNTTVLDSTIIDENILPSIDSLKKAQNIIGNNFKIDSVKPKLKRVESEFTKYKEFSSGSIDLNSGLKIVTLFSLDCEHCLQAAHEIAELKKKIKLPSVYSLFLGSKEEVQPFFNNVGMQFSYLILEPREFFMLLQEAPPKIVLLAEGNKIKEWTGNNFNQSDLRKTLDKFISKYGNFNLP